MNYLKRIISFSLATMMLCTQFVFAATSSETNNTLKFSDLDESFWGYGYIEKMKNVGYIDGYLDGTFKPNGSITRAEFVKLANQVFKYTESQSTTNLTDVKSDEWFYEDVLIAQETGYISGYTDNTFKPNKPITREELAKILDSINKFVKLPYDKTPSDEVSPWAMEYVNKVLSNRIMTLDNVNNFRATQNATRAEACKVLAGFIIEQPEITPPAGGGSGAGDIDQEELHNTMNTVIRRLKNGTIPDLEINSEAQIEIINRIISSMENYIEDNTYNYEAASDATYEKYKQLTEQEQKDLKDQIQLNNTTSDLLDLKEFFFPDLEIK